MKKIFLASFFLLALLGSKAQNNFTFTPEKPHPGDKIVFTYTPPPDFESDKEPLKCVAFKTGPYSDMYAFMAAANQKPVEVKLTKNGNRYQGEVLTDSTTCLLTFSFTIGNFKIDYVDDKFRVTSGKADNNDSSGYYIQFYSKTEKVCEYSSRFLAEYLNNGFKNGLAFTNPKLVKKFCELELESYPESKYAVLPALLSILKPLDSAAFKVLLAKETEKLFAGGLKTEQEISLLSTLSGYANLPQQNKYYNSLRKEKFSAGNGAAAFNAKGDLYDAEKDPFKKEQLMEDMLSLFNGLSYDNKMNYAYSGWSPVLLRMDYLAFLYENDHLEKYNELVKKYNFHPGNTTGNDYFLTVIADTSIKKKDFAFAEKFISECYHYYKTKYSSIESNPNYNAPQAIEDEYLTLKQQKESAITGCAMFSDYLAQLYTQTGQYKKGYNYAKEASGYPPLLDNGSYIASDFNAHYAVLAEKVLPGKKAADLVAKLIASGYFKPEMKDILKRLYVKENKSEAGFDDYFALLRKNNLDEIKKSLQATMINDPAPSFALKDLNGQTVKLEDLKGKTIVLDFWATWCGPCKASFPGMQKLATSYKDNPDVAFLFVNTFEKLSDQRTEEKLKQEVSTYLKQNNYAFHVLFDAESGLATKCKVAGIPTKLIIDKNGNIRYNIVGAETNEVKLFDEMNTMIESVK